jgi:NAD(P)-dependent dehydrogenase (short-subunit alcohol dehydrogenase family)
MKRLKNKVVMITGGAGGIGSTTARLLLDEGASVMLVDINEDELRQTAEHLNDNDRVAFYKADVSIEKDVKDYVDATMEKFGHIDVFFNNAGIEGDVKPITEYPVETFEKVFEVNVKGVWLGLKYAIPAMKKNDDGGSIIITSSVAGLAGTANVSPYVGSKHALVGIMKSAALELAPYKIRVNTINPSPVDNRMMRSLEKGFGGGESGYTRKQFEQMIPMGRYAKNEEIAALVLYLASDDSTFITGSVHRIDGGMLAS